MGIFMTNKTNLYKELCRQAGVTEGKLNDEYMFTIGCVDTFFFHKNISLVDISDGFVDGSGDGGVDFVLTEEDVLYLIQGKSSEGQSSESITNAFSKIISTIDRIIKNQTTGLSRRFTESFINSYDSISDQKRICLVLFTNTSLDRKMRNRIEELSQTEAFLKYTIVVYDKYDIESKQLEDNRAEYVDEYRIKLTDSSSLKYQDNGLIVNLSANSLKKLYLAKHREGLFSYNLREHIHQANVDNAIDKTINKEAKNFWFYNNGVTIGCEQFDQSGNTVTLYNFSIINGAQTTTKIGESPNVTNEKDFAVVCKIVKPSDSLRNGYDFLMKISEASNSQKPIKPRDLKANLPEQKILQKGASRNPNPLSIEIKRGVKPENYRKVESWQRVSNDLVGQLILACILQRPGDARTSSSYIFDNPSTYVDVFRRKHDYDTLFDLVKLLDHYETFRVEFVGDSTDIEKISVAKSGRFTVLAVIIYILKIRKGKVIDRDDQSAYLDNISGRIFSGYRKDDYEVKLKQLFRFIVKTINDEYQKNKVNLKVSSHSAFLKNDSYYRGYILKGIDEALKDEFDKAKIDSLMELFVG
jgi:hypothetical protein